MPAVFATVLSAIVISDAWLPYLVDGRARARVLITDHGAVGDNATMNTAAFASAFGRCVELGGGYVVVPPGRFLTGRVELQSNCYLMLHPDGILQATTNISEYGGGQQDKDEHGGRRTRWSAQTHYVIRGAGVANSGVIAPPGAGAQGGGEVRGTMWQSIQSYDPATNSFTKRLPGAAVGNLLFVDATNISVVGVSVTHSGFWAQTFRRCSHVLEEGIRVEGSVQWGTADGMDVESGYNLTFRDSVFKTGDDCLAFRSGAYESAVVWPAGPVAPVRRVRMRNLTLTSSSAAIKLEASTVGNRSGDVGEISDVVADGVTIRDTNRGVGIWQRSGNATMGHGRIRDVAFRNIDSVTRFDPKPEFWGSGEPLVVTVLPRNGGCCAGVENVSFEDSVFVSENSALLSSLSSPSSPGGGGGGRDGGGEREPRPPAPVTGIRLINVSITVRRTGNVSRPQRDYRPSGGGLPQTVPSSVAGIAVENVAGVEISGGGGVRFSPLAGPGREAYWGMACLNVTGESSRVSVGPGWECHNKTQ